QGDDGDGGHDELEGRRALVVAVRTPPGRGPVGPGYCASALHLMLGARLLTARVIAAATVPPTARASRAKMAHSIAVAPSSLPLVLRHWAATSAIKACTTWNIGRFSFPLPGGWDAIVE